MDPGTRFLGFIALCLVALSLLIGFHPLIREDYYRQAQMARHALVQELGLTDLCLFTEARYTRHLSQADLHSAFQDHPLALEHFPSGALVPPPPIWRPVQNGPVGGIP